MSWPAGPIPASYWVQPGRLCAGEYPYAAEPASAEAKLRRIRDAGVDTFIDLTEAGEYGLAPYAESVGDLEYRRFPIRDNDVPSVPEMRTILDVIDDALKRGRTVYVHCWGGVGRTGTVIACYMVRQGATAEAAIASIAEWRRGTEDGYRESPEMPSQMKFVSEWRG